MSMTRSMRAVVVMAGCGAMPTPDAGLQTDAGNDAGTVVTDAGHPDGGVSDAGAGDAGTNAPDAGLDAGADAGLDAGFDAGIDAGVDAGIDAGVDAGVDAGPPPTGCRSNGDCASGMCLPSGHCRNCVSDSECADGGLCGTGVCSAPCGDAGVCTNGASCCHGRCVDPSRDPLHCNGCDQACTPSQFCARSTCREATFGSICEPPVATALLDGEPADDQSSLAMSAALGASCTPMVDAGQAIANDAGLLRVANGEPLQLGELLVAGGGSFRQRVVAWADQTPGPWVRDTSTATDAIYSLPDGGVVSSVPFSMLSPARDRVLIQLVRSPTGALVLNAAGFHGEGTRAAAEYFVSALLPNRANLTTRWYVIEWTDTDSSGGPSAGDGYALIASGP